MPPQCPASTTAHRDGKWASQTFCLRDSRLSSVFVPQLIAIGDFCDVKAYVKTSTDPFSEPRFPDGRRNERNSASIRFPLQGEAVALEIGGSSFMGWPVLRKTH